jgi:hypothetical protein
VYNFNFSFIKKEEEVNLIINVLDLKVNLYNKKKEDKSLIFANREEEIN